MLQLQILLLLLNEQKRAFSNANPHAGADKLVGKLWCVCTKHPFCAVAPGLLAAGSLVEFPVGCLQCLFSHVSACAASLPWNHLTCQTHHLPSLSPASLIAEHVFY